MAKNANKGLPTVATLRQRLCGLESVFDAAPIGLCVLDLNFRYMTVNTCFARMHGLAKQAFIDRTVEEAVPGLASQITAHLNHALEAGGIVEQEINFDNFFPHADPPTSKDLIYLRTAQPVRDENGTVYGISVALLDITQRKRTEAALRESAENLRFAVELTPHIPWTADASGEWTFISPRWNILTGGQEEVNHLKRWAEYLHPDDQVPTAAIWRHSLATGEPYDSEYRIAHRDGEWHWVRARAYPRRSESGQIIRWYGTLEDIHERNVIALQLAVAIEELARTAQEDYLTGLPNRRRFDEVLKHEIDRFRRSQMPIALVLLDIDHFKRFNDIAGHLIGDQCLRLIAQTIDGVIRRPADLAARFGGEEFALILPDTDRDGALEIAQRTLAAIRLLSFPHSDVRLQKITISAGVAAFSGGDYAHTSSCSADLVHSADVALYQAKANGRDCVVSNHLDSQLFPCVR
ncbi:diguanylate cyclase (GGDEF)-like protein/PAS domain S-box-containing protein [Granulicella aggregans]|uniref:Diguanylate cyclase (GGDEF)-like protein/PAS domain S-box-containing protein n=1 Tax=Granulicella aggregans TaxID=474949 RepID=A0A7W8E6R8_9BACT|nr:diguanylate cyclase [Granulicella aggregans]MBB5060961.1 diguanylate cyclase (GGDEF)-like protein/PAS domain S-box-containing protein [Granulicella aggregans]